MIRLATYNLKQLCNLQATRWSVAVILHGLYSMMTTWTNLLSTWILRVPTEPT